MSFDLTGDGNVSTYEFFLANYFDQDRDGKLNELEREEAIKKLKSGFEKQFEYLDSNVIPKDTKDPDFFKMFIESRDRQIRREHPERFIPRCKTADVRLRQ